MNTRTYPRTLNEAFPKTTQYACALERPAPRQSDKFVRWALAAGALYVAGLLLWEAFK